MSAKKPKQYKTSIFDILGHINNKDYEYYANMPEEERKSIAPLVLMRWMSGVENELQIMMLNEYVNPAVFNIYEHPELLWKLMCVCSPGHFTRYKWMKQDTKKANLAVEVIKEYYKYSTREATQALPLLSKQDVIQCATELGYEATKITKLKKEL